MTCTEIWNTQGKIIAQKHFIFHENWDLKKFHLFILRIPHTFLMLIVLHSSLQSFVSRWDTVIRSNITWSYHKIRIFFWEGRGPFRFGIGKVRPRIVLNWRAEWLQGTPNNLILLYRMLLHLEILKRCQNRLDFSIFKNSEKHFFPLK